MRIESGVVLALIVVGLVIPQQAQQYEPSSPQQPPPSQQAPVPEQPIANAGSYTLHATSRLVLLDVVVTDKAGRVVNDLTQNDFAVLENKEAQKIRSFERPALHIPPANVTIDSTQALNRLAPQAPINIIVLDEFNTRFEDMAFAQYSLKKYLGAQREKLEQPTMLVAVSLGKFTVLHDYTQDRHAIEEAIDHHLAAYPWQREQRSWFAEQYSTAFATLMQMAGASSGHPGHKNIVWVGRGFPPIHLEDLPSDTVKGLQSAVEFCVNMLRDARVTLYTVDPAGLPGNSTLLRTYGPLPGSGGAPQPMDMYGQYSDETAVGNVQFDDLARATGGRALHGRNNVDGEIATSIYEGANFYTLSYIPPDMNRSPSKFRKIEVVLTRPGLTVTTRRGYYVQPPPAPENMAKPSQRLQFDLLSAASSRMVYDAVPLTATLREGAEDIYVVHVLGSALGPNAGLTPGAPLDLAFVLDLYDKKDKLLKRVSRNITIPKPSDASLVQYGFNVEVNLKKSPGAARARFVVRMMQSGKIGTADLKLESMPALSTRRHRLR